MPTAEEIAALADGEQLRIERELAQQHKMLAPPPDRKRELILQDFYHACDKARVSDRDIGPADEVVLVGLVALLSRFYGQQDQRHCDDNGRLFVSDWKQHHFAATSCVAGLRKSPAVFVHPVTCGGMHALIHGGHIGAWPDGWLVGSEPAAHDLRPDYRDWQSAAAGEKEAA